MTSAPSQTSGAPPLLSDTAADRRRRRKAPWVIATVAVLVVAGVAVAIADPFSSKEAARSGVLDNSYPTSLATVTRQDLTSQTQLPATLGYAGSYTAVNQAVGAIASVISTTPSSAASSAGTFTSLPAVGQLISQGQVLYQVSGAPVVLLYGSTPAYRALSEGMTGADVTQLNADLVALGYVTSSELSPTSDYFSYETFYALERLQVALGETETGTLALGQAVFLPTAVLVTSVTDTLGGPAQSGATVLAATSTARQVDIALDASQQSEVSVGDKVAITLPNNQSTPGVVTSVGTVATAASSNSSSASSSSSSGSSTPTITVLVTPTDPAATGTWDQAPVNVTITSATVSNVLAVPVNALVALSGGGYSVEVIGTNGLHHLVSVSLGLFDDAQGLVQVTGSGLAAGQHVVVPGS
ncbi:MAG TPA: hypothetical protein VNG12_13385 [Acidimicrobiales bacterium]|nr:hypothetical protein [Acidimicrobiales bacterium]